MNIGQRIKERRKELKMSADELGQRLGKDRSTIYRYENGVKKLVFDTKGNTNSFIDKLKPSTSYQYSIVPYFVGENKTNYGKEIFLSKIKTPNKEFGDDWWKNDFE